MFQCLSFQPNFKNQYLKDYSWLNFFFPDVSFGWDGGRRWKKINLCLMLSQNSFYYSSPSIYFPSFPLSRSQFGRKCRVVSDGKVATAIESRKQEQRSFKHKKAMLFPIGLRHSQDSYGEIITFISICLRDFFGQSSNFQNRAHLFTYYV